MVYSQKVDSKIDFIIESYYIETIEEVGIFAGAQNAMQKFTMALDKIFSNESSLKALAAGEERSQQRREAYLKEQGIDVNKLKAILKQGGDINIKMSLIWDEIVDDLKNTTPLEILKMIFFVAFLFLLHDSIVMVITAGLIFMGVPVEVAETIAYLILVVLIPGLTEEFGKRISIQKRQSAQFYIGFNLAEGLNYIIPFVLDGGSAAFIIFMRILAAGMHALTTAHHIKGNVLDKYREDFGIKNKDENVYKNTASSVAYVVHAVWNSSSILGMLGPAISTAFGVSKLDDGELISKKDIQAARDKFKNQPAPAYAYAKN